MKNIISLSVVAILCVTNIFAQDDEKIRATLGTDIVSHYVWRGQDCGNVSVQPTLGVGFKGFEFSAWGSVGFDSDDTKELDLTLSYSVGKFNIMRIRNQVNSTCKFCA